MDLHWRLLTTKYVSPINAAKWPKERLLPHILEVIRQTHKGTSRPGNIAFSEDDQNKTTLSFSRAVSH